MITKRLFGVVDGCEVYAYNLKNAMLDITVIEYGATIQSIKVKRAGEWREMVLGYDTIDNYVSRSDYFGVTVGRVANRISGASFTLGGREYHLDKNDKTNCLHGGFNGFDKRIFRGEIKEDGVTLYYTSEDGDQGFPGALNLEVEYTLLSDKLDIRYRAVSDKDTLFAPTNHSFFNFSGGDGDVYHTHLKINADYFTPVDGLLIPTGELRSVENTPFEFRYYKKIGRDINAENKQLAVVGGGYDHNFVLKSNFAASAMAHGIRLDIYTDMPGVQFYSGNFLNGTKARGGKYKKHGAFCLEPQFFPDAINIEGFLSPIIRAGQKTEHYITYNFILIGEENDA